MDKKKISIDSVTFKFLYGKYKDFGIPVVVIVVCIGLLAGFIVPQFQNLLDLSKQIKESEKNLEVLKKHFDILSNLDENSLDSQLSIVNTALPGSKDFVGIINAITYASSVSGVGTGDFQLSVGELSENESSLSDSSGTSVSLTVQTDIEGLNRFISALTSILPLSEITGLTTGDFTSSVIVNFYHKPFPLSKKSGDISPIAPIDSNDIALINKLANFNYVSSQALEAVFEFGTSSADLSEDF